MKIHDVVRDAVQLYLGCPVNLYGVQLFVKRAAGKILQATKSCGDKLRSIAVKHLQ